MWTDLPLGERGFAFLCQEELEFLSGYKRKKDQRDWLARHGIAFVVNRLGSPIVSKAVVIQRLSHVSHVGSVPQQMPDLDALEKLERGSTKTS